MKKFIKMAFSLVELMVTLIVVSCLIAAMAPVITKKLKNNSVTISGGATSSGGGSSTGGCDVVCASNQARDSASCTCTDCSTLFGEFCLKCDMTKCAECTGANYLNSGQCKECDPGYFCDGTNRIICPKGFYCVDGEKSQCPSGTYNDSTGASASTDCINCVANCASCDRVTGLCEACEEGYDLTSDECKKQEFLYTYTGSYSEGTSEDGKQKIIITTNGTFSVNRTAKVTLYLIGGGGGGGGGQGGGGGNLTQTTATLQNDTTYDVVIGAGGEGTSGNGGTGGTTSFGGSFTALGATGGYWGWQAQPGVGSSKGGQHTGNGNGACTAGGNGVQIDGIWYAGGGGGGTSGTGCAGGKRGGGKGGSKQAGTPNTGGGGGGGCWAGSTGYYSGGDGGSGIVIIIVD